MDPKKMERIRNISELIKTCAWCGMRNTGEIISLGCKKKPGLDISQYEGEIIPLEIISYKRTVWAFVPGPGSPAFEDGKDFLFTLCSNECVSQLREALKMGAEIVEEFRLSETDE
ncbi:MAG: hypothetical protein GY754_36645 [bacterium]|nr:hypothetical protein [bacterium]